MSRGLRPLWFKGPLPIPNGYAKSRPFRTLNELGKCPSRRRQVVESAVPAPYRRIPMQNAPGRGPPHALSREAYKSATPTTPRGCHYAGKAPQLQKTPGSGPLQVQSREAAESATPALHPQPSFTRPARFFFGTKSGRITCPRFQSFSGQEAVFRHGPQYHGLPQRNSRTPGDVCDPSCRCLPAIPPHRALSAPCSVTRVAHLTRPRLGAADPHDTRRPPWDSQVQRLEDLEAVGAGPGVGECPNTAEPKSRRQTRPSHLGPYARHEDELANGRGLVSWAEHSVSLQARTVANIKMEISRRDVFKEMAKKIFTTAGVLCPALSFLPVPVHPPLPIAPDSQHRVDFPQLHVRTCALLAPDTHPPASSARTQRTNPRPRKCARTSRRWARSRASPGSKRTCTRASGTSLRTTTSPRQALPPTLTERPNRSKDLP